MTAARGSYSTDHNPKFDEALDRNPPVIVWAKGKHGIQVAVEVHDPHAERSSEAQAERLRRSALRAEWDAMEDEAREVAERFLKHRADNSPLQAAARTI